ncbi:DUF6049 family protein [Acidiferrimicrobium sp. IK]|uniref:DUF6049 family protein n=1 Tax=Acidiferrimicrobium sp. IK TaxID=2871700 RepID=UPI0021CB2D14|nr:DUF6049 family protein [Acidiferrimicrobium sp. IK]MCU4187133.1 DUF6049 family protein [Acidiferrimicrobium sp. IK]
MTGSRTARLVAAIGFLAAAVAFLAFPGGRASAASPTTSASAATPSIGLAAQTPVVTTSGTFHADLKVTAPDPTTDRVYTAVYSRLTSRSDFDQAVGGHPRGYQQWYNVSKPLATLTPAADGTIGVDVPVNPKSGGGFYAHDGSAVYPVAFQVYTGSLAPIGKPTVTFLVFSSGPSSSSPRLAVSLTVPVGGPVDAGPTPTRLPASASSDLASLVSVLQQQSTVPVTLDVQPEVLDRLGAGDATDRATLASLAASISDDQLLASPYYPLNRSALYAAGLSSELQTEYRAGAAALASGLHRQPDTAAAAVRGPLDETGFAALLSTGVSRMVLPDADMSTLSALQRQITFASPTTLNAERAGTAAVMAADPELSGYLTRSKDPVLAGEQLLAGLSLVQLEAPSVARAVALLPPGSGPVDPAVLGTVLAGLKANPLLAPVTVDNLFRTVPAASPQVTRTLVDTRPPVPEPLAGSVRAARAAVAGLAGIAPNQAKVIGPAQRQLLFATSSVVAPGARAGILAGVETAVKKAEAGISLPGSSSITLTARTGTIPLTVLSNPSLRARVQLRIVSPKLTFRPFGTSLGTCTVTDSTTETCQLTLTSEATTLRIPVETRTSGVFAMLVTLASPDGGVVLASNRDTVRSTAFSDVGVVLIVVAALGLIVWWVRNARHGRRARQLVDPAVGDPLAGSELQAPPAPETPAAGPGPVGPDPARPASNGHSVEAVAPERASDALGAPVGDPVTHWLDDDPVISEFFSSPAPRYDDRAKTSRGATEPTA